MSREREPVRDGDGRNRRNRRIQGKKKALRGPAKRTAGKLPKRPPIIAAARRRVWAAIERGSRRADRTGNRGLERSYPPLRRAGRVVAPVARRARSVALPVLSFLALMGRRALWLLFRGLALGERAARTACRALVRAATAVSAVVTPQRAVAATIVAAAGALVVSQFIDYRGVEIGGAAYAGLPDLAQPPAVAVRTAGEAHSYLLAPLAVVAAVLGVFSLGGSALDPLFAPWHEELGLMYYRAGRLSEAEAEPHKVIDLSPIYAEGYYFLAQILLAQGKPKEALAAMLHESPESGRDAGLAIAYHALNRKADSDAQEPGVGSAVRTVPAEDETSVVEFAKTTTAEEARTCLTGSLLSNLGASMPRSYRSASCAITSKKIWQIPS